MPKNNETTTKFKVDISELQKAMQEAKRAVAVANSEFKAVSSSMDDWTKSSDGLSAKLKQLDTTLSSQKTVLKSLEAQYEALTDEEKAGSKAADDLRIKINNQQAAINKTQREVTKFESALEEVSAAEKTAAKTGQEVADVLDEMGDSANDAEGGFTVLKGAVATFAGNAMTSLVGAIKDGISNLIGLADETREYRTELGKLTTGAEQAGASTDYIKDKWQDLGSVLGDEGAVTEGLNNLLAAGFTTEEEMDSITKSLEGAAIKWKDTLKFEGLADGLQETLATGAAVGSFGEMLERSGVNLETFNAGLSGCTTEAEKQNYVLEQLSGLGLAEVSDAYRAQNKDIIKANKANAKYTDTMAALGGKVEPVMTTVKEGFNSLLQEVLKLVEGVDMEAFSAKVEEAFGVLKDEVLPAVKDGLGWIIQNKDILVAGLAAIAAGFVAFKVASLIQSVTTALQGMSIAQAALNAVMAANPIGLIVAAVAGLVAGFIALWNNCDGFREFWINLWDNIKNVFHAAVDGIVKFFTETIPEVFNNVINFIKENWDTLLLFLINPFAGLFKYFYENNTKFKEFVDNAVNFIKELPSKIGQWLTETMKKVGTWFTDMTAKAKEAGTKFVEKVVEFVKQLPSKVWTWLKNTVSKVTEWASNMATKGKDAAIKFVDNAVNFIKELPSKIWTWLSNAASKVVSWGNSLKDKAKAAANKLISGIVDTIKGLPDKIKSIGSDIVRGLWNGINDMASWIGSKIKGFGEGVLSGIKSFFGINSPSKLMRDEVGKWIPEGIAVGIDKNAKSVLSSMRDLTAGSVAAARDGVTGGTVSGGVVSSGAVGATYNFTQINNSPKALSRLEIYRQSKNLLGFAGGA